MPRDVARDALYSGRINLWVEDNLTRAYLSALWDDTAVKFVAPTDGNYRVTLRDRYGSTRGDASLQYRLIIRKEIVYGLTNGGDLLRIDPFTAKCVVLKRTGISWWGATDYQRL